MLKFGAAESFNLTGAWSARLKYGTGFILQFALWERDDACCG